MTIPSANEDKWVNFLLSGGGVDVPTAGYVSDDAKEVDTDEHSDEWVKWQARARSCVVDPAPPRPPRNTPLVRVPHLESYRLVEGMTLLSCVFRFTHLLLDCNKYVPLSIRTSHCLVFVLTVCETIGCIRRWRPRTDRGITDVEVVGVCLYHMSMEFDDFDVPSLPSMVDAGVLRSMAMYQTWEGRGQRNLVLRITTELFSIPVSDRVHPWRPNKDPGETYAIGKAPCAGDTACDNNTGSSAALQRGFTACATTRALSQTLLDMTHDQRASSARLECNGECVGGPHVLPIPFGVGPIFWGLLRDNTTGI